MRTWRWPLLLAVTAATTATPRIAPASPPSPGDQPTPPPAAETVGVTASHVAVDVVVRDGKGRLVRDLKPGEVELLEDGVPQALVSLRLVDTAGAVRAAAPTGAAVSAAQPSAADARAAEEPPLLVALLFDRLSPQARRTAHEAALEWLKRPAPAKRMVGVFRIDQTLQPLLAFSSDTGAAEQALEIFVRSQPTVYTSESDRERLRVLRDQLRQEAEGALAESQSGQTDTSSRMAATIRQLQLGSEIAMLAASEALERDQQGLTTVNAILALVNGMKAAPGRKAVLFFSEGLVLPPRVASSLRAVISEANRAGVTFYAADAAGLRTVSAASESRKELQELSTRLATEQGHEGGAADRNIAAGGTSPILTRVLERTEDILRSDPNSGLGTLAQATGGFLISDTNAIAKGLQAATDDLGSYYLLGYAPANELWDGRFRRIEVRVKRPGVHVQARQGYFAVKTAMPTPLLDFEAPVLAAVEMAPRARELAFRAAAVRMPDQADESAVSVIVDVPGDSPTLYLNQKDKRYEQDFTVLVLVRDEAGRVVRKLSRRFANGGALDKAEEARRSRMMVLRETWLPPGRYTVDVVVQDAATGRLGVERVPLEIPDERSTGLRVGSVVIVGHAAKRSGDAPAEAPSLVTQGLQIYPGNGAPVSRAAGKPIAFFVSAQQEKGRETPRALVELLSRQAPVFQANVAFQPAIGRATLLGGVPLDDVQPGDYMLRVTVEDGVDRATRSALVTVAP